MKINDNTVLITGGSSGIGLAIAQALLNLNNRVIICGRNQQKLAQASQAYPQLHTFLCDVTKPDQVSEMFTAIKSQFGNLNLLVNNAGIIKFYDFLHDEDAVISGEEEIATNLVGTLRVTKAALPLLLNSPESAIVNLSSIVALVPSATTAIYSATKAAVHSFSCSLRQQLQPNNIKVFEVMPPFVDTEAIKQINTDKVSPAEVAEALIKGLRTNNYEIRLGPAKALYFVHRLSPTKAEGILKQLVAKALKSQMMPIRNS
ncbi:SDR family oxidoreductase [Nostoc sp. TCL26-01]|uniref:SDR family oxidoreductase n=1 Tax=Nostoc sp. TCL26-01 TaxID=2576904 RepID=UPI0015BC0DF4|nr:SDR family NAD(P)-dependent oxidoreductase [Nostoc sp. TCL26-01]QLE58178.1 SDR family NAD(P)-dependent oxidoreductase [Nostoc sp. TCL26-01]